VAWTDIGGADGEFGGVFAQRFDAAGTKQGAEFLVNTGRTADDQTTPAVDMDDDGNFVVVWQSEFPSSRYDVFARRYNAAGATQGTEFQVNTFTSGHQNRSAVAMDADGDFVVAWQSFGQDDPGAASETGVFAQRYDGGDRITADFDGDANADVLWRRTDNGNTILWLMDGTAKKSTGSIGNPGTAWVVAGTGDFNGDRKADILWRNTGNGNMVLWLMDGFTKLDSAGIGGAPSVWEIEAIRDTNGDGLSDIFWRNSSTGATLVWQMSGFTKVGSAGTGAVGAVFEVQ
jgi:hypothetical protein